MPRASAARTMAPVDGPKTSRLVQAPQLSAGRPEVDALSGARGGQEVDGQRQGAAADFFFLVRDEHAVLGGGH